MAMISAAGTACAIHPHDVPANTAPTTAGAGALRPDYPVMAIFRIVLPPVDEAEQAAGPPRRKGQPLRVGFPRAIPAAHRGDLQPSLRWVRTSDGATTAVFTVTSPSAQALRLALDVTGLPEGVAVRFFSLQQPPQIFGPLTTRDMRPASKGGTQPTADQPLFWSPVIHGETIGVELTLATSGQERTVQLKLSEVSHIATMTR